MEKLIELLNEFGRERQTQLNRPIFIKDRGNQSILISKSFCFIKWLVEKNKIDFYNILKENGTFRREFYAIENKKDYERLIMLLSISDKPIEDLISYLK